MAQPMAATCFNGCALWQVHWLLQLSGIACTVHLHQKDPHALCEAVIEDLKAAGFSEPGISSSDLGAGWGNAVISVLNSLANLALKSQRFSWTQPLHHPEMYVQIDIDPCKSARKLQCAIMKCFYLPAQTGSQSACRQVAEAEVDAEAEITAEEWADDSSCSSSQNSEWLACSFTPQWEATMPITSRQVPFLITKPQIVTYKIPGIQACSRYLHGDRSTQ